jgi:aminoglycoside phosphotransferase family enzyme
MQSECALVLFVQHRQSSTQVVVKVLQAYNDTRYSLATQQERLGCQLEALWQNRRFTPGVYLGLAQIETFDLERGELTLGQVIAEPCRETLESEREYALLMRRLPAESRLDVVLEQDTKTRHKALRLLARRIAFLHLKVASPLSQETEAGWGSNAQLREKLVHNLRLLDLIVPTEHQQGTKESTLQERVRSLQEGLLAVFTQWETRGYFERRVSEQRIRRCHGDLKSPNIWIAPGTSGGKQGQFDVLILDGADFNPSYTHIDLLSDLALLVVDIQARTQLPSLAERLTQHYLQYTDQCDETSRAVLNYYLVEKAIVGAAISLAYDHLPALGHAFLQVAEQRLEPLRHAKAGLPQVIAPAAYTPVREPQ